MSVFDFVPHFVRLSDGSRAYIHATHAGDGSLIRVLEVGGVYQSATYLDERWAEPVFNYYKTFDALFDINPQARQILMIGGGGFAWPKHVVTTRPANTVLDVVEVESAIIDAAKRWFYLERAMGEHPKQINVVEGDGRLFLEASQKSYDGIVIDAFTGGAPVRALATVEAFEHAKSCLVDGGAVLANVVSGEEGTELSFLRSYVAGAREVFSHVQVVLCDKDELALEDNYLVVASDSAVALDYAIPYDEDFLSDVITDALL